MSEFGYTWARNAESGYIPTSWASRLRHGSPVASGPRPAAVCAPTPGLKTKTRRTAGDTALTNVYEIDGVIPVVDESAFVHPNAVIIGDVVVGRGCYIGPCACLRGDFGRIVLHAGANIQDNCVVHSFPDVAVVVEQDGHVGHGAILHGCHVGRNALVGMNAVVMDDARIGENAIIGAMAFVKAGMQVPKNTLAAGTPAKVIRELSEDEIDWKHRGTEVYHQLVSRCKASLKPVTALTSVTADRKRIHFDGGGLRSKNRPPARAASDRTEPETAPT